MEPTQRTWTAQEIAGVLNVTDRAIRKRGTVEGWPYARISRGKGPKTMVYAHAGLPTEVQASLLTRTPPKGPAPAIQKGDIASEALHCVYDRKSDRMKGVAQARLDALLAVESLVADGVGVTAARELVARQHGYTAVSLWRWSNMVVGLPKTDWLAALVPGYVGRTAQAEMDERAWDCLKGDYLRLEGPTLAACYVRLVVVAAREGWAVPSERTVCRKIEREIPRTIRVLLREGEQALAHLYPAQERDKTRLSALEWINGDGYKHNVFVRWPGIKDPVRPKTWVWQDIYSGKILSYRIDLTENTDTIRLSTLDLVDAWGLPVHATIDNTRAAANKWMTGGIKNRYRFKVRAEDPLGVFPSLGVTVHWAMPGWGQSKPVERCFGVGGIGEHVDKHPAMAGAWCGNNPGAKPENYASTAVPLADFEAAMAQGVSLWNNKKGRRTAVCGGVLSFNEAFLESYGRAVIRKATPDQRALLMLCAEAVRVQKDGTIKLQAGRGFGMGANRYGCDRLMEHIGKRIVVRFDPQVLHAGAYCYTLTGKFIAEAPVIVAAGFGDTQSGREHNRARNRFKRATKDQAAALQRMDALEVSRMLADPEPERPEARVIGVDFGKLSLAVGQDFEMAEGAIDVDAAFAEGVRLMKRDKN